MLMYQLLTSLLILLLILNASDASQKSSKLKHQRMVDSLRKREAKLPDKPDPISYLDDATAGTFKPINPPKGLEEPLDETRKLAEGYRILVAEVSEETEAKQIMNQLIQKENLSVSMRFENDRYKIMLGNFQDSIQASNSMKMLKNIDDRNLKVVRSKIFLSNQHTKQNLFQLDHKKKWFIQVAAFSDQVKAQHLKNRLQEQARLIADVRKVNKSQWIVTVGDFSDLEKAKETMEILKKNGYHDIWLRQIKE